MMYFPLGDSKWAAEESQIRDKAILILFPNLATFMHGSRKRERFHRRPRGIAFPQNFMIHCARHISCQPEREIFLSFSAVRLLTNRVTVVAADLG